ncbi:MAG: GMC family oxidoreductase N-terminal domain-containing protein [Pseudomonadota bacterium]
MQVFDYVIVGGGSAGAALAARLSACGRFRVFLIEAGGPGRHPWLRIPIGYGKVFYDDRFNWKYQTEPEATLNGRSVYWPRGKVLGGSSAINAMVWVRGHPGDYEEWAEVAPGWGWQDVAPVFQRMEDWRGPPDPSRGVGGPQSVTDISADAHALCRSYIDAARQTGFGFTPDYNAASMSGASFYQITTRDGLRASASDAYLRPAGSRANLDICTNARATGLRFDGRQAVAVEYRKAGATQSVSAKRDIILCGGAINSPQLLMVSGVGPGAHLRKHGIEVMRDLPQVGRNLMDHLGLDLLFASRQASLNQVLRPWWGKARVGLRYLLRRDGPLSMSLNQAGGFVCTKGGAGVPDFQLYFSPLSYSRAPSGKRPLMSPDPFPAYRLGFNACKPTSRGYLELRSSDPLDTPKMHANYLSTEEDCRMMIEGTHLMRRIAAAPALGDVTDREMAPGPECRTDEAILDNARAVSSTVFHQSGTCRMGKDAQSSVVDARLRVHGLEGLRVADASVFPNIPSGNTNAPSIMVGERAADLILEEAG